MFVAFAIAIMYCAWCVNKQNVINGVLSRKVFELEKSLSAINALVAKTKEECLAEVREEKKIQYTKNMQTAYDRVKRMHDEVEAIYKELKANEDEEV